MKIKIGAYPGADPQGKIAFLRAGQEAISLVFARRLAAYVEYVRRQTGKPKLLMRISSGYRDVAYQQKLYDQNVKQYPPSGNGYVAKPGNSWHSGRVAVDVQDDGFWKGYMIEENMHKTRTAQPLYKYGLYLPLNYKDANSVFEWWHIQPVELYGAKGDRTKYLDADDKIYGRDSKMDVLEFQRITGLVADNIPGAKTKAKAKEVKEVIDYILGVKTGTEAIQELVTGGVDIDAGHWKSKLKECEYLDILLMKVVNQYKK